MVGIYRQRPIARRRRLGEALGGHQEARPLRPGIGVVGIGNMFYLGRRSDRPPRRRRHALWAHLRQTPRFPGAEASTFS